MCKKLAFMTVLFFLFFSAVIIAEEVCIACEGISDAPESSILLTLDELAEEVTVYVYYENYTAYSEGLIESPRMGISDSIVFVYVTDSLGNEELLRLYTDDEGRATFDFSDYAAVEERLTYGFRFIYCPFCHPGDPGYPCGFEECMEFAGVETNYTAPEDVPIAEGVSVPSPSALNDETYLPSSKRVTYIPPPPEATGATTPAFCLPLILIFALLGGAMLYTGRNPFAGFAISTPRMGRHIRYTPSGRGYSLDTKRVAMSVQSGVSEAKGIGEAKKKGMSGAEAVGAVSFRVEKGKGRKMVRDTLLNMLTLGTYGSTQRTITRLKEGVATQQRMAAAKEGTIGGAIGISGISAKEAGMKGKIQYRAAKKAMAADSKKAIGKIVGGAFKNLGIGLMSSTFMGYAMSGVVETMLKNTDAKIIDQAYTKTTALEVAEEDRAKAQGGHHEAPPAPVIEVNLEDKNVSKSKDGKMYVYESPDGSRIELEKDAADGGVLKGKKTVTTADGKNVTYHFTNITEEGVPKSPDAPVRVTEIEVKTATDKGSVTQSYIVTAEGLKHAATSETIGTGADAVTRNYAVQADGTQKLVQVMLGEEKGAQVQYTLAKGPEGTEMWVDSLGQRLETKPRDLASAASIKAPEVVSVPTLDSLGVDAPGDITGQIGNVAKVVVDGVYLKGVDGPVKMEWAVGAERDGKGNVVDYQYAQQLVTGDTIQYTVEDGRTDSAIKIGKEGTEILNATGKGAYKTFEGTGVVAGKKTDVMDKYSTVVEKQKTYAATERDVQTGLQPESTAAFLKETGLGKSTSGYCDSVQEQASKIKVIGDDNKEHKIDSKAAVLLVNSSTPTEATPEQIEQSIKATANQGAAGEISSYGQNKVKEIDLEKPGVKAGINAAASTGTSVADMNKSEYMATVNAKLDLRTDLTAEQKTEAQATAEKMWGKNGNVIKKIAQGYENAADQALHAYPQYAKIQDSAIEQHFSSLYEGKDASLKNDIVKTAKAYGAGSADNLNNKIMETVEDKPDNASFVDTPAEKTFLEWSLHGIAKPPEFEEPVLRKGYQFESSVLKSMEPKEGETEKQYEKRMEEVGLAPKEGEGEEEYHQRLVKKIEEERNEFDKKIEKQHEMEEKRWGKYAAKYVEATTGTNAQDALVAQSLLLSAYKKGNVPDDAWNSALRATTNLDMNSWKSAAKQTAEYIKKKQSEKQKKMAKELGEFEV